MLEIIYHCDKLTNTQEDMVKSVVNTVLDKEGIVHEVDVYITLMDDDEIHKINKEYRNVDRATDVLSFPMAEKEEISKLKKKKKDDKEEILGDILISVPRVKSQAEEYGHSFERELAYLVTHGMLHLLGYDHMEDDEKAVMREHEEAVLQSLNINR
jgi:probable rRNA maturation factor